MIIEILKGAGGWYWRMKARNGKILAHSETYSRVAYAVKTVATVTRCRQWDVKKGKKK